jgi:hypothetical protein
LEKEAVRSAFCDQEIKTNVTCEFQVQLASAEGKSVLPKAKILTEERRKKRAFCDQEFLKRREWRTCQPACVTTDPERDGFSCQ